MSLMFTNFENILSDFSMYHISVDKWKKVISWVGRIILKEKCLVFWGFKNFCTLSYLIFSPHFVSFFLSLFLNGEMESDYLSERRMHV